MGRPEYSKALATQWTMLLATTVGEGWGGAEDPEFGWKALKEYFSPSLNRSLGTYVGGLPSSPNPSPTSRSPCGGRPGSNMAEEVQD